MERGGEMVWVIGSKGMLGQEITKQLEEKSIVWVGSDSEVDITNPAALDDFAESHDRSANRTGSTAAKGYVPQKITWVINCAGYTAVDDAEENQEAAQKLNAQGALNIARATRKIGAKLIHISTDYVFDGRTNMPYKEDDAKYPLGVYGRTKSEGEDLIQKEMTQYYILRTSWLYGFDGNNFVYTMTKLMNQNPNIKVVNDQKGSPTFAGDLAAAIIKIIETSANATRLFGKNSALPYGLYNYSDLGETTWYDFARKIYEFGKKYKRITSDCTVDPCSTSEYPTRALRPFYSVMSKDKILSSMKIKIPHWEESLEKFIKSSRFCPR